MNGKLISSSNNTYLYRAYLETWLSYGQEAKSSQLTSSLLYADTQRQMDGMTTNSGVTKRSEFTDESITVDMIGRLHLDMFMQSRYLLNGVDLKVRLVRSNDEFVLMTCKNSPGYKISLQDVSFYVRKVSLNPGVPPVHIKYKGPRKRSGQIPRSKSGTENFLYTRRPSYIFSRKCFLRSVVRETGNRVCRKCRFWRVLYL